MAAFDPILLIAVPQLVDPNFKRSVVLILQHDPEGAFGLVINDPTPIKLLEFSHTQKLACHRDLLNDPIYCGGPVEPYRGWILHQAEDVEEKQELGPGLYISSSNQSLKQILAEGAQPLRFLLGYAGWGPLQLEKEMEEGSWITAQLDPKYVFFENPHDTWDAVLHDMGVDPARLAMGKGLH